MRQSLSNDEFGRQINSAKRYAWRWEQQPVYEIGYEQAKLQAFLDGRPEVPTDNPDMVGYLGEVRAAVAGGRSRGRVRVVEEPPTGYQRWLRWMDRWNREAGEEIHYLKRSVLEEMARPPIEPAADWWLIDDEKLLLMKFAPDGSGRRISTDLITKEPDLLRRARLWRLAVVSWAIEEEKAALPEAA